MTPFHLATVLTERSEQRRKIPKRTRTRYSILAATAREMEKVGYDGLTIDNIVDEARLARGTFYLYFTNRSDVAAAVIRTYRALVLARRPRGGRELKAYDAILRMNKYYVATYAWNAPLLAGIETLVRESTGPSLQQGLLEQPLGPRSPVGCESTFRSRHGLV
jgi:AcrR family transcriptional regulator